MACTLTAGRSEPCKEQVGGIDRVYFINFDGDSVGVYNAAITWENTGSYTGGDGITSLTGTPTAYEYEVKGGTSFTQNIISDRNNGTTYYEQVLEITLKQLSAADHKELKLLAAARPQILIKDNNGNHFLAGFEHGMDVTGGTIVTGTEMGDLSGYTLTFTGMERVAAPFVVNGTTSFTVA